MVEHVFETLDCACKRDWRDQLAMEAMFQGSYSDPCDAWAGTIGC